MSSESLPLSVVICCHTEDRWDLLRASINSIHRQIQPVHELIVVTDHNPVLAARLRDLDPDLTIIANAQHPGLSGARNTGVRAATGDIVAFIDDDAEAARDWSMRLLAAYDDEDVLGVGGRVIPRFEIERPEWFPPEFDWVIGCTYKGHRSSLGPIRNMIGANMSLRRRVFDSIGGFRSDLGRTGTKPAGCEETELCIRAARELGGVMWYQPDAVVHHFVPATRTTRAYFRRRCFAEGQSKATIARVTGRQSGLASERGFVTGALPNAVVREVSSAVTARRPKAWSRAGTVGFGLGTTAAGYFQGRIASSRDAFRTRADAVHFEPAFLTDIDADEPADVRPRPGVSGRPYSRAIALVRRRGLPVRMVELALGEDGLDKERVAELIAPLRDEADRPAQLIARRLAHERPLVSVIIATRDRPDALARCLESLRHQRYEQYEVIVVDNGSESPDTAELVARAARIDPRVRYVWESRPGLARAHNRGLGEAHGSISAFTDDDVVVDENWLTAIVDAFHEDPAIGCVTGLIAPLELETVSQAWIESSVGFSKGFVLRRFDPRALPTDDPLFPFAAGRFGSGANMSFRTDVLREIGGFDAALGAGSRARGGDDLAAFFDVIVSGNVIVYEPGAIVRHAHRPDYESLRRQSFGYGVGLGAYLAHVVAQHPRHAFHGMFRVRHAAKHFLGSRSAKNAKRPGDYPKELQWRERWGVLLGPGSYARSRFETRRDHWTFNPPSQDYVQVDASAGTDT